MSSCFDQKPRLLVELFIFIAGFLVPLWRILHDQPLVRDHLLSAWKEWIYAPTILLPAGFLFVVIRIADWLPHSLFKNLGESELREFAIAWFLMWYLLSYAARLKHVPTSK